MLRLSLHHNAGITLINPTRPGRGRGRPWGDGPAVMMVQPWRHFSHGDSPTMARVHP